jgi:hypothetical protein
MVEAEFRAVPLQPRKLRKRRKPADRRRLSELLSALAAQEGISQITVLQLRDALGRRAYGAVLFLLALLNLLPLPPGGGILLALIVMVVSAQMIWGTTTPYFPRWLARRSVAIADFRQILSRLLPMLQAAERIMKPRLVRLQGRLASRAVGLVCLALGGFLLIPTPFGGNWPPALAMAALALAYLARDGLLLLLGLLLSAGAMILTWEILTRLAALLRGFLGL